MKKKEIKKVVFYYSTNRLLRTTLIGHLYEITQVYPVILLAEELDQELEKIIKNKELFPKLERIIFVYQHTGSQINIIKKNYELKKLAKDVIFNYKPDLVITPNDLYPFEMYLLRFAKKINAVTLSLQPGNTLPGDQIRKKIDLVNAHIRFPKFFPFFLRSFFVQCRKYYGHILYYWILPILAGEKPFFGKSSYILKKGGSGMRDADYQIVFSERDYNIFLKDGVFSERIYILSHPLKRKNARKIFEKILLENGNEKTNEKFITFLVHSDEVGFRKKDHSFISQKERLKTRIEIIKLTVDALKDYKIFIKPHPNVRNFYKLKEIFEPISPLVKVVEPSEPVDKYIKISSIIIGLPISMSTALFYTFLMFPEKIIISLDFDKELIGDFYEGHEGIKYIDNKEEFIETLKLIKNNKFIKRATIEEKKQNPKEFPNFIDLINALVLEDYGPKK